MCGKCSVWPPRDRLRATFSENRATRLTPPASGLDLSKKFMLRRASRHHKRDANHKDVDEVLTSFGWTCIDTSGEGGGFPDMVIGLDGITDLVEVKDGEDADFTDDQIAFYRTWRGSKVVVIPSKQAAIAWAAKTRHNRRVASQQKQLTAIAEGSNK